MSRVAPGGVAGRDGAREVKAAGGGLVRTAANETVLFRPAVDVPMVVDRGNAGELFFVFLFFTLFLGVRVLTSSGRADTGRADW